MKKHTFVQNHAFSKMKGGWRGEFAPKADESMNVEINL